MNFSLYAPRRWFHATVLAICFLTVGRLATAQSGQGETVAVPGSFLASRMVRPIGAAAPVYRVVIDVPPASSPRAAKPRITEGSGDGAVDGIAWDYVKETLRKTPRIAEQNTQHELRFPLRLSPVAISLGKLQIPAEFQQTPREGFSTPAPRYPPNVKHRFVSGECRVRGIYPAAGGPPVRVVLEESSGDRELDAFTVQWVLLTWRAAPGSSEQSHLTTFAYQLR